MATRRAVKPGRGGIAKGRAAVVGGAKRRRRKQLPVQMTLGEARKPDGKHGGWRPGAGRPRGRKKVAHVPREDFTWREPLHVTWRIAEGVRSLRREAVLEVIRDRLAKFANGVDFRVVEFNVLGNHLHLVVEATGRKALARGMHGLAVRRLAPSTRSSVAPGSCSRSATTRACCGSRSTFATSFATSCSMRATTPRNAARRSPDTGSTRSPVRHGSTDGSTLSRTTRTG
jgi:hypothetical protein